MASVLATSLKRDPTPGSPSASCATLAGASRELRHISKILSTTSSLAVCSVQESRYVYPYPFGCSYKAKEISPEEERIRRIHTLDVLKQARAGSVFSTGDDVFGPSTCTTSELASMLQQRVSRKLTSQEVPCAEEVAEVDSETEAGGGEAQDEEVSEASEHGAAGVVVEIAEGERDAQLQDDVPPEEHEVDEETCSSQPDAPLLNDAIPRQPRDWSHVVGPDTAMSDSDADAKTDGRSAA